MKKQLLIILIIALFTQSNIIAQDYALGFDGVATRVIYNSDETLSLMNGATDYTIEAWIKPTSDDIHNNTIVKRYYQFALFMYQDANRRVYFTHYTNDGTTSYVNSLYNVININEWNHVAVINNSAENTIKLFVNGVDVTSDYSGNAITHEALPLEANPDDADETYDPNFYVGYSGTDAIPTAFIDKVRLKNAAEDIANLQTSVTDAPYALDDDTVLLFNFNEGSGDVTVNEVNDVNASLQCTGGCEDLPTWTLLAETLSVVDNTTVSFSIFPNPVSGNTMSIQSPATIQSVMISDLLGKVVFTQTTDANQVSVSANLTSGVYLIQVETAKGTATQKLIVE